ncbi:HNH endonuclease [Vibrio azureus]|uniref:HNH nuclease domain-containing protein n=1 Tax=Vibrio azureus NBRC 104587 TaxID=1219077 RepID=U3AD55_9VIBR|nr:HNH endonuclease [Vibrio azureus]AUI88393.1 HNH endonuclease [Vibrio azureus]GAD77836.1 hypothetical protein VAZ01S_095_00100 [Vibrio azureus NBRC 104587]
MWSPKENRNGTQSHFYNNMTLVRPGDVIFSFVKGLILSVGIARSHAYSYTKPAEFGSAGDDWSNDGWKIDLEYHLVNNKVRPKSHIDFIRPLLPEKYSPLQENGNGNQAYLFVVPINLASKIIEIIGSEAEDIIDGFAEATEKTMTSDAIEYQLLNDKSIGETDRNQLVKARRGQGLFRSRIEQIEPCCRVTGISFKNHLIASHIKPWSKSDNRERLDGNNGLLLAPHVDHLFDKGYISFENNGEMIVSKKLNIEVLKAWSIERGSYGKFSEQQQEYLSYHRLNVLK